MDTEYGYLTIRTYTADEAIPIDDVGIEIRGTSRGVEDVKYFVTTDVDGVSPMIKLSTPGRAYSLAPHPRTLPYSTYDIVISKDGYYTKLIKSVAIFSGVKAELPINMIALESGVNVPIGNLESVVTENKYLEG